jgi:hypothetical protein
MDHYRTYLRGELGKLRNLGDARCFLARAGETSVASFNLRADPDWLTHWFSSQERTDAYVDELDDAALIGLTERCEIWRHNGVAQKLRTWRRVESLDAPVEAIRLRDAESALRPRFAQLRFDLVAIANDPVVLAADAYCAHIPGDPVGFPRCLATREPEGRYRILDGMHRAIQLVRNGERTVPLCVGDM